MPGVIYLTRIPAKISGCSLLEYVVILGFAETSERNQHCGGKASSKSEGPSRVGVFEEGTVLL